MTNLQQLKNDYAELKGEKSWKTMMLEISESYAYTSAHYEELIKLVQYQLQRNIAELINELPPNATKDDIISVVLSDNHLIK